MLRDLPEPRNDPLPQAPVALVVWQLQFSEPADVVPPAVGAELAERLARDGGGPFQLQRLTTQTFAIAFPAWPPQVPQAEQAQIEGWALRRGAVAVTVNRQSLSVETNDYETWAEFPRRRRPRGTSVGRDCPSARGAALGPPLRRPDRATRRRELENWRASLAPWLIGPLTHPHLRDEVTAYAQQVDFDAQADGLRATLRQRAFADAEQRGTQTVILDFEYFEGYVSSKPTPRSPRPIR